MLAFIWKSLSSNFYSVIENFNIHNNLRTENYEEQNFEGVFRETINMLSLLVTQIRLEKESTTNYVMNQSLLINVTSVSSKVCI